MMFKRFILFPFLLFAASFAAAQEYPAGNNKTVPGVAIICSDGTQAGSGPCGTVAKPIIVVVNGATGALTPLGYQQITSLSASTALTAPTGATVAVVSVETQGVRYRDDGTAPTASVGMPLASGQTFYYAGSLSAVRFIEQTASAKIDVSYYK